MSDPKPTAEAALLALQRIATACEAMDAKLATLLLRGPTGPSAAPARVAPDIDLDGPYGDPEIRAKDPRDWSGPSQAGKRFSECSAAYLDLLAERFDFFNSQETDEKKRSYNTRDAARARGWAARVRAGWKHPATPAPAGGFDAAF